MVQCNGYDLVHDENVDKNYSKNASLDKESNRESCRRQLLKRLLTRSKGWCSCTRTIALGNTHPPSAFEEQLAYKRGITSSYENCESRRGFARHKYSILRPRSVPQQTRLHDHFRLTVRSEQPSDKTLGWQRPRQSPHLHTGYPTGGTNPRTHRTHSLRAALPGPVRRIESLYIYIYIRCRVSGRRCAERHRSHRLLAAQQSSASIGRCCGHAFDLCDRSPLWGGRCTKRLQLAPVWIRATHQVIVIPLLRRPI
jgi:hypothetical protein